MIFGKILNVTSATWQNKQYAVLSVRADLLIQPECNAKPSDLDHIKVLLTQAKSGANGPRTANGEEKGSASHPYQNGSALHLTIGGDDGAGATLVAHKCDLAETTGGYALYNLFLAAAEGDLRPLVGKEVTLRRHEEIGVKSGAAAEGERKEVRLGCPNSRSQ